MASSAQPETPLGIWASLARIRDISRMVLAAIERDDLAEIALLSREGKALLAVLQPVLERMTSETPVPEDICSQLKDLAASYQSIVCGLESRKEETRIQLEDVRRTHSRLRSIGLDHLATSSLVDRTT